MNQPTDPVSVLAHGYYWLVDKETSKAQIVRIIHDPSRPETQFQFLEMMGTSYSGGMFDAKRSTLYGPITFNKSEWPEIKQPTYLYHKYEG